jgi:SPP1 family predicted phage head-tail adaptor
MIAAGLLNKTIKIQHLTIERDEYGSDTEIWEDLIECRAAVKGFDGSAIAVSAQILIEERLVFTIRRHNCLLMDKPNHYRIEYKGKIYHVYGLNSEDRDNIIIIAQTGASEK